MSRANSQLGGGSSGPRKAPKPLLGLRSCSFARFLSQLVILCSHWRPENQIYRHKRGAQTKKTAPKDAQQRVRETAAEERCLESFVAVFAETLATRLSGGSARACARKAARRQRRPEGKNAKTRQKTNAKRRQRSSQKAKAARRHEGKDTPKNQREKQESRIPTGCADLVPRFGLQRPGICRRERRRSRGGGHTGD